MASVRPKEQAELQRLVAVYRLAIGITNKQTAMDNIVAYVAILERRAFERALLLREKQSAY